MHQGLVHLHLGVEPRLAGEEATQDAEVRGGVVHHGRDGQELRGRGGGGGARERARASRRCATRRWGGGGRSTNRDRRRRAPGRARRPIGRRGCRREGDGRRVADDILQGASRRGPRTFARTARWGVDGGAVRVRGRRVRTASPDDAAATRARREGSRVARPWRRPRRPRDARTRGGRATNTASPSRAPRRRERESTTRRGAEASPPSRKVASRRGARRSRRGQAVRLGRRRRAARYKRVCANRQMFSGLPWSVI